jgi:hypothetical protein
MVRRDSNPPELGFGDVRCRLHPGDDDDDTQGLPSLLIRQRIEGRTLTLEPSKITLHLLLIFKGTGSRDRFHIFTIN